MINCPLGSQNAYKSALLFAPALQKVCAHRCLDAKMYSVWSDLIKDAYYLLYSCYSYTLSPLNALQ